MFLKRNVMAILKLGVRRWKIPVGIHKQGRYKLTHHIIGGNVTDMCNRHQGRPIGSHNRHYPRAFLHADMEQAVHMLLKGTIAMLIVKLEPSLYRKCVWHNKHGKPCYM